MFNSEQDKADWVVSVEYNYIHDFGAGITNDFGGIKTGSVASCDGQSEAGLERNCYTYIRLYNNLVRQIVITALSLLSSSDNKTFLEK